MSILVTGASGFVGRHLLAHLRSCSDLRCTGLTRNPSDDDGTIVCDLNNKDQIDKVIKELQPSIIFHVAGSFSNNFETDFQNNVVSSKNIFESIRQSQPKARIVLMGSAAEYGEIKSNENPVTEEQPLNPISIYGWSKAAQTQLANLYFKTYGLDIVIARTFNLIGKGMSDKLFVGRIEKQIDAVLAGKEKNITVGNLDAKRDYIDIDKACALYYKIAQKGKAGETYNVGSGTAISMRELLKKLLEQANLGYSIIIENEQTKKTPHSEVSIIYSNTTKTDNLR
ncbi:MAG: NAD-dependent epimerase/dehydratase family protein [Gammaproteobacteria bacterium]|nr:NAD-dependent epimerase/dehydratase family protein [Gammaproteobacteria bacterium]